MCHTLTGFIKTASISMAKNISDLLLPDYWDSAKKTLSKADPVMKKIIRAYEGETMTGKGDPFLTLARSIVGQQISVKAAESVWRKLETGLAGKVIPASILLHSEDQLRSHGLSRQKALYLQDLARYFTEEKRTIKSWAAMDDETLIQSITSIRGIGRWTAEMFLMFHLLRPDVLPVDDIGLQKAVEKHYGHGERLTRAKLRAHGEMWRPYRTVATWYLWRSLDPVPVEY